MLDRKSSSSQEDYSEFTAPRDDFEKILRSTVTTRGKLCDTYVEPNDQQNCIKISEGFSSLSVFYCSLIFAALFTYFAPAVVCLYSATKDTHEGIRKITVEGPSPVGFRSLIGNYFFNTDNSMWHMARKFIMRVLILPLPVLVPAIFVEYLFYQTALSPQTSVKGKAHLFQPFRVMCYCCYCIQAFYFHFIVGKVNCTSACVCEWDPHVIKFIWTCSHQELPQRMLTLHRTFWNFIVILTVMSSVFFVEQIPSYQDLKNTKSEIWTCNQYLSISFLTVLRFLRLIILVLIYFLIYCVFLRALAVSVIFIFPFLLSPVGVLCISVNSDLWLLVNVNFLHRCLLSALRFVVVLLDICLSCLAAFGVMSVLKYAAVGIMIFLQLAVTYVLSEENLPFLTCFVLVCCYLWSSYRSFTQKYQDLAAMLLEQYDELTNSRCNTDLDMQGFTSDYGHTIDNVKRIPKELFAMACEELMPIKSSIYVMVLKVTLIVILFLIIFSFTLLVNEYPVTRTLLIFVTGSLPKIANIYFDRRSKRNLKLVPVNEKARKIVHEYINIRSPCHKKNYYIYQKEKGFIVFPRKEELKGQYRVEQLVFIGISFVAALGFVF